MFCRSIFRFFVFVFFFSRNFAICFFCRFVALYIQCLNSGTSLCTSMTINCPLFGNCDILCGIGGIVVLSQFVFLFICFSLCFFWCIFGICTKHIAIKKKGACSGSNINSNYKTNYGNAFMGSVNLTCVGTNSCPASFVLSKKKHVFYKKVVMFVSQKKPKIEKNKQINNKIKNTK